MCHGNFGLGLMRCEKTCGHTNAVKEQVSYKGLMEGYGMANELRKPLQKLNNAPYVKGKKSKRIDVSGFNL